MEEPKDQKLWKLAKRRAAFQQSLYAYVVVNIVLWIVWWFADGRQGHNKAWPWPLWALIFWGIAIFFEYMQAYARGDKESIAEEEYNKLKKKQENQ